MMGMQMPEKAPFAKQTILIVLAVLMAMLSVASMGARPAQALTDNEQRSAIMSEAYRLKNLGTPYVNGFTDPCSASGADCECLNRLAFKKAGIYLYHTLGGQIDAGRATTTPVEGDLVFFDQNGDGDYRDDNDHTGVYSGLNSLGERTFIHASAYADKVVKQPVSETKAYYGNRPVLYVNVVSYR